MGNTSYSEDQAFATAVFGQILGEAIDWIEANLDPDDVFSKEELGSWAECNGYELKEED